MPSRLGCPNRNKKFLHARLKEMYGEHFNPILRAAEADNQLHELAQETGTAADLSRSVDAWVRVGEFVEPRLKATTIEADGGLTVSIQRKRYDGTVEEEEIDTDE